MLGEIEASQAFSMEVVNHGTVKRNVLICGRDDQLKSQYINSLTDSGGYTRPLTGAIECDVDTHRIQGFTLVYTFHLIPHHYKECRNASEVFEKADLVVYVVGKDQFDQRKSTTLKTMADNYCECNYSMELLNHDKLLGKPVLIGYAGNDTCDKEMTRFLSLEQLKQGRELRKTQILKNTNEDRVNLKRIIQLSSL